MLGVFLSYLLLYKYLAIFLVTFLASLAVPLPATAILMATGAFAAQGYFNFYDILAVGFFGSVLGDVSGYFISFKWGKDVLMRIGFKPILNSRKFVELEKHFSEHSGSAIFYSRWLITGLGSIINLLSGLSKVSYKKFLLYDLTGELLYVLIYAGLGFLLNDEWQYVSNILEELVGILALIILIYLVIKFFFRKNKKK